jgi:hypothetical protein
MGMANGINGNVNNGEEINNISTAKRKRKSGENMASCVSK